MKNFLFDYICSRPNCCACDIYNHFQALGYSQAEISKALSALLADASLSMDNSGALAIGAGDVTAY